MHRFIVIERNRFHFDTTTHRLSFGTDESPLKYFLYRNGLNNGFIAILRPNPVLKLLATIRASTFFFKVFILVNAFGTN